MEEKNPHPNQYKEPHFTCEIHYGPDSDKRISADESGII